MENYIFSEYLERDILTFEELLKKEPGNILAKRRLALAYQMKNQYTDSINLIGVVLREDHGKLNNLGMKGWTWHDDQTILGLSFLEIEAFSRAERIFRDVKGDYCENPLTLHCLGRCHHIYGKLQKSKVEFCEAVEYLESAVKYGLMHCNKPDYDSLCMEKRFFVEKAIVDSYELLITADLGVGKPIKALMAWAGFKISCARFPIRY